MVNGIECCNNQTSLVHLQQPWFVAWDRNVTFNKMLHNMNIFLMVWSTGVKICLT